jgi:hypothetical protein
MVVEAEVRCPAGELPAGTARLFTVTIKAPAAGGG